MSMNSGIYQITHRDTGRIYIGQSTNLKKRVVAYKSSGGSGNGNSVIKRAIKKYGWDSFDYKILVYCEGKDYLDDLEIKCIKAYNCLAPNGFNIEIGGGNAPIPDHVKEAVANANRKRILTDAQRKKLSDAHKKRWANMSEEDKQKYRDAARPRFLGKKLSAEHCQKISESHKKGIAAGTIKTRKGKKSKPITETAKKQIGAASKLHWQNPEYRAKMIELQRQAAIKRWQNPEYRAKVMAAKGKK
jgi:group I intron endonuclease